MTSRSQMTDWTLIDRLVKLVNSAPGGGLHRLELGTMPGVPDHGSHIRDALMIAYSRKRIDFCGQYVVRPVRR